MSSTVGRTTSPQRGKGRMLREIQWSKHLATGRLLKEVGQHRFSPPSYWMIEEVLGTYVREVRDPDWQEGDDPQDCGPPERTRMARLVCRLATRDETLEHLRAVETAKARLRLQKLLEHAVAIISREGERASAAKAPLVEDDEVWDITDRHGRPARLLGVWPLLCESEGELWVVTAATNGLAAYASRACGKWASRMLNDINLWSNELRNLLAGEPMDEYELDLPEHTAAQRRARAER